MLTGHSHLVYFNDVANYFGSIDYLKSHGLSKAKMYLENSACLKLDHFYCYGLISSWDSQTLLLDVYVLSAVNHMDFIYCV